MRKDMMTMAREMEKAGLIEEITSDMMDDAMGTDDIEDEADAEVQKVFDEIAAPILKELQAAPSTKIDAPVKPVHVAAETDTVVEESLVARLDQL